VYERVGPDQLDDPLVVHRHAPLAHAPAAGVDVECIAADDIRAGVLAKVVDLPLESLRQREVVGIHARDERAARCGHTLIQYRAQSAVRGMADEPNARIRTGELLEQPGAAIRRTVVDDQELEVLERLLLDAADRVFESRQAVVDAHQHRDRR
jgi:hypothetical protein